MQQVQMRRDVDRRRGLMERENVEDGREKK
jgi:hypothetical protein